MRHLSVLAVLVLAALAGCGGQTATPSDYDGTVQPPANDSALAIDATRIDVEVTRVVDGDTIEIRYPNGTEDTVRLQGIDTPEVEADNQPGEYEGVPDTDAGRSCLREAGSDASDYVEGRIDDGTVTIAVDPKTERRGDYGRLLAYVYVGDANLNYELVATGRARVYDTDFTFRETFERAEQQARGESRGLWDCANS